MWDTLVACPDWLPLQSNRAGKHIANQLAGDREAGRSLPMELSASLSDEPTKAIAINRKTMTSGNAKRGAVFVSLIMRVRCCMSAFHSLWATSGGATTRWSSSPKLGHALASVNTSLSVCKKSHLLA